MAPIETQLDTHDRQIRPLFAERDELKQAGRPSAELKTQFEVLRTEVSLLRRAVTELQRQPASRPIAINRNEVTRTLPRIGAMCMFGNAAGELCQGPFELVEIIFSRQGKQFTCRPPNALLCAFEECRLATEDEINQREERFALRS